jgi:SAM-dependent methyltransferase/phage repressor protein C with HTH and peptisase S24 domain
MDRRTLEFYNAHAPRMADCYAQFGTSVAALFPVAFPRGARVLDLGCGSGRDLNNLIEAGYDAFGVDASPEMLSQARLRFPRLSSRMTLDDLPQLATIADQSSEGVLCSAILMHLPEELLFDTVFNIRRILKQEGRLLLSTPVEGPPVDPVTRRDEEGRLFNGVTPENFQFLFEKIGFRQVNRWDSDDQLGRANRRWATQLFVLVSQGSRSLDRIEAILNRDKKDATYKPALFRALAELATTSYHSALWLPDGKVSLSLDLIADKWIEYYWPLMESELFIPQKRGEKAVCQKPVAFRFELERLIALYKPMGGLGGFTVAYRSNAVPKEALKSLRKLKAMLRSTIKDGPLYYSGGGGSHTFSYRELFRSIVMDADLWRELSIMGTWIADATLLRWAELTAEISQGALKPSQVIDLLLRAPIPERDVHAARSLYEQLPDKVCVWTDKSLETLFEVDHAIPFALWKNNDLWNLLPARPAINNQKRDRLPTLNLLRSRKDCILHYWSLMREQNPNRFDFEAGKLAGPGVASVRNWENRLFSVVSEAVEVTALQRGVDRWEPTEVRWLPAVVSAAPAEPKPTEQNQEEDALEADLIVFDPPLRDRFVTCVPYHDLAAAAGDDFGPEQPGVDPANHHSWIRVGNLKPTGDMFAIRVVGRSMEPKIPDGSYCLFRGGEALAGTREGRIVLVALRDSVDPETGGRLTVKRYSSEKIFDEDGNSNHTRIQLSPLNREYEPILLEHAEEGTLRFVGEFVRVMNERRV